MTAEADDGSPADPAKLRRFAIGVALVMGVYVLAGGTQIDDSLTVESIKIKLTRAKALLWLIPVLSLYASVRYWWYAIKIPLTRNKIRKYLHQRGCLLVVKLTEKAYREQLVNFDTVYVPCHAQLEEKVPPGLTPFDFIVFTDSISQPTPGYMAALCRNRIDIYFPGIKKDEISIEEDQDHHAWASPSNLHLVTRARAFLEGFDLWLPICLNVIGLLFFLPYAFLQCEIPFTKDASLVLPPF